MTDQPSDEADRHGLLRGHFLELDPLEPGARALRLAAIRATQPELARELEDLLRAAETSFLERPLDVGSLASDGPANAIEAGRTRLGRYRLISVLGAGSSGIVYLAEEEQPRRTLALKVLRPEHGIRASLARFRREAELLAQLPHPGIVQVFATGIEQTGALQEPWIAMEYVPGCSLAEHVRTRGLGVQETVALLAELAEIVQVAHASWVVHRDLKPENVRVDPRGRVRVLDFGVARVVAGDLQAGSLRTRTGELIGTLA